MQKWEYQIVVVPRETLQASLTDHGNDGWELTSSTPARITPTPIYGMQNGVLTASQTECKPVAGHELIFKRAKAAPANKDK